MLQREKRNIPSPITDAERNISRIVERVPSVSYGLWMMIWSWPNGRAEAQGATDSGRRYWSRIFIVRFDM